MMWVLVMFVMCVQEPDKPCKTVVLKREMTATQCMDALTQHRDRWPYSYGCSPDAGYFK